MNAYNFRMAILSVDMAARSLSSAASPREVESESGRLITAIEKLEAAKLDRKNAPLEAERASWLESGRKCLARRVPA